MALRVAVLDLGTNTFNLVVAEQNGLDSFQILHSSKLPVKLGEGGINRGQIISAAFHRGIDAVNTHYRTIKKLNAEKIFAFGTSALRSAKKGHLFISTVKRNTGIDIEIISGDQEAELIYYGVRQTYAMTDDKYLILDIGGGSNELIIANKTKIFWKHSYDLGIARLLEKFRPSDPITSDEIESIKIYLAGETKDLLKTCRKYNVRTLLGASGSFETFVAMIKADHGNFETEPALFPESIQIESRDFNLLYEKLINSTIEERKQMKGLEPMRIEMIVLACLFVKFILEKLQINTMFQSNFSLKEGVIYQMIKNIDHGQSFSN
jgi:exopolyphosphatase/guanosine-5'-triphosphate,3'-diphosphate pyrophosphatase